MAENRNHSRVEDCEGSCAPSGLSQNDSDEWGSIADLLKSIENTNQSRCAKVKSPPPPQPRMPPLTENIQSADLEGMPNLLELQRGQGMQQLNHLLRLMDQMCALQKQNSKLREQAEYLAAIKNLHELRNETLRQNCHCDGQRRASDLSSSSGSRFEHNHATGESLSEPESQIGEDMDGDIAAARGEKRGRSMKRDGKNKNIKKRSRSLDPFGEEGDSKDRSKQGLFYKMKDKFTNRRGSVKRRSNSKGDGTKSDDEGEEGKSGPPFPVDGLETKSEDSGIYHIGPDELASAARLEAFIQKSTDDISDNEDIFQGTGPLNWARTAMLAQSRRKGSDLSTGSSGEDYLESKPKRVSPSEEVKSSLASGGLHEMDEISTKRSRFRRTASCQDDELDGDRIGVARSMGPVEEKLKQKRLLQSHSLDVEMTDASGASERESGRMSGSEFKHPQKRKYFRKSQTVDLDDHSSSSVSIDGAFKDVRSPKASPPEKKKHRGGGGAATATTTVDNHVLEVIGEDSPAVVGVIGGADSLAERSSTPVASPSRKSSPLAPARIPKPGSSESRKRASTTKTTLYDTYLQIEIQHRKLDMERIQLDIKKIVLEKQELKLEIMNLRRVAEGNMTFKLEDVIDLENFQMEN